MSDITEHAVKDGFCIVCGETSAYLIANGAKITWLEDEPKVVIKSNGHVRELVEFYALPLDAQEWFDYVSEDEQYSPRFFQYRGSWYDVAEFELAPESYRAKRWDGWQTESAFSAVLIRYADENCESVIVGYTHW